MLYSCRDKCWKVADFGLSVPGSASTGFSTSFHRGTAGYRAPELIFEREKEHRTNKCDIWAAGVVLYELVHHKPPFENDSAVRKYYANAANIPVRFTIDASTVFYDERSKTFLSEIVHQMLSETTFDRPTAQDLHKSFKAILAELLSDAIGAQSLERLCPREHGVILKPVNMDGKVSLKIF